MWVLFKVTTKRHERTTPERLETSTIEGKKKFLYLSVHRKISCKKLYTFSLIQHLYQYGNYNISALYQF